MRHWVSDVDAAVLEAQERMTSLIQELRRHGITVNGAVGDADPLMAIDDALVSFPATQIIISSWPAGISNWLEKDLVQRAAARFTLPIKHLTSLYDAPLVETPA